MHAAGAPPGQIDFPIFHQVLPLDKKEPPLLTIKTPAEKRRKIGISSGRVMSEIYLKAKQLFSGEIAG